MYHVLPASRLTFESRARVAKGEKESDGGKFEGHKRQ